jgi:hypothetical protein
MMKCLTLMVAISVFLGEAGAVCAASLEEVGKVKLDGVNGRIDHLAYDAANKRLFVAALGNNTVEIIDAAAGKRLKTLTDEAEPQGVRWLSEQNVLVVASGQGGRVDFFDGTTFAKTKSVPNYSDADNVRYDGRSKTAIVGWGSGALTWFSPNGTVQATAKLPGHPESFQIHPAGSKVFVNVPSTDSVIVVDALAHKVVAKWPVTKASANYPLCINPAGDRAFVATRRPPQLITFDTATGAELSRTATSGDADDVFYDPETKRIFESCGEGYIDVFQDDGHGKLNRAERISTGAGARTSLYVAEIKTLFLAVPARVNQDCEIRVFKVQ